MTEKCEIGVKRCEVDRRQGAGHSHQSDLLMVRSMQTDAWKCLSSCMDCYLNYSDNPEQMSCGFFQSFEKFDFDSRLEKLYHSSYKKKV